MQIVFSADFLTKNAVLPKRPGLVGPVFHGTDETFHKFELPEDITNHSGLGIHFGNAQQANTMLEFLEHDREEGMRREEGANYNIHPVYLKIKNPLRLPDLIEWHPREIAQNLARLKVIPKETWKSFLDSSRRNSPAGPTRTQAYVQIRKWIEKAGFDSVVYRNKFEGSGDSYIVWHINQIIPAFTSRAKAAAGRYYHGSTVPLRVGTVLKPGRGGGFQTLPVMKEQEDWFEAYKPEGVIGRQECIYMCASPRDVLRAGGGTRYVYEVQPIGRVDKSDQAWYGWPSLNPGINHEQALIWGAENYWSGAPFFMSSETLWEYRCRSAKVLRPVQVNQFTASLSKVAAIWYNGWITPRGRWKPLEDGENHAMALPERLRVLWNEWAGGNNQAIKEGWIRVIIEEPYWDSNKTGKKMADFNFQTYDTNTRQRLRRAILNLDPEIEMVGLDCEEVPGFETLTIEDALKRVG